MRKGDSLWTHVLLVGGLLLIGMNLRPAITGIAPLVDRMIDDGVEVGTIGMQTTLPLMLFGLASVLVGVVGNWIGFARALALGLLLLATGCFARSWGLAEEGVAAARWGGPLLVGLGIAFGNVLLPAVVKSRYPSRLGLMTSLYSTAMNVGAALGFALAVPLADALAGGWNASLGFWGVAALSPLLFWIPQIARRPASRKSGNPFNPFVRLAKDPRAWQVTTLMGLQSLLFYSSVAWLPVMLQERGMGEAASYGWPTVMQLFGCAASLTLPTWAGRLRSQAFWASACGVLTGASICGILWLPLGLVGAATVGMGIGLNGGFGMALLLIAMRSKDASEAGYLSAMAQTFGYVIAAPFPWFVGWLSDASGSWYVAYGFLFLPAVGVSVAGALAGRAGQLR
ncbi:MFS transporter [Pelagicoccus sp. SDUM812005]|uniref:MFS transporter n=1 Tax=Pelagicoccus sp. SDUM812005 TaxID=3041257 RepID=UPI00281073E8|nr:MFS transporter [Pelagicoccus sp. SDUM812005]MDQ8180705.1 MFS transporter [Pelagicoccus sp. SDUM812005]